MKEKISIWLQTVKQLRIGVSVCGVGFLLYIMLLMLEMEATADVIACIFGPISVYVFFSVVDARSRDKEAVTFSLLWGAGALMIMLAGCAILAIKFYLMP